MARAFVLFVLHQQRTLTSPVWFTRIVHGGKRGLRAYDYPELTCEVPDAPAPWMPCYLSLRNFSR